MVMGVSPISTVFTSRGTAKDRPRRLVALAMTLACLGGVALFVDLPVARLCKTDWLPGELRRFLNFAEVFGHGFGVATILAAAAVLDPSLGGGRTPTRFLGLPLSRDFLRMVVTAFAGGILANIVKATLVDRVRPRAADLTTAVSALATFGDSVAASLTSISHSDFNSFPSGHAATAAGLAVALSWKYPRGWWFFAALAAAAAVQRVSCSAHYPSDVLLGAALGLVGGAVLLGRSTPDATTPTANGRGGFDRGGP